MGLAIFKKANIKDEVELQESFTVAQLRGISRPQHLAASIKAYQDTLFNKANDLGMDFDVYLERKCEL